ncbi:MAG: thiamine pyrophosphate-dependent enzyme [Alphaproteobacteria bacterium]|nr:thiamine pyrophosphate-dependent enzyme [Alphaproteobacteria bacterium]MCY4318732.1 thiamine pyrophosphate-dependent enzyme [Alphaproteobacteria bacterium]
MNEAFRAGIAAEMSPVGTLDRREAVPALVGDPQDWLIVAGLAGTARDTAALCEPEANYFACAGVMGGAVAMGLGLALARPDRSVLVLTGDGELLMNVGSLATVAILNPPNLSIVCVDNGHYGETGYQKSHTSLGVDLAVMASGAGIPAVRSVSGPDEIEVAGRLLREANGVSFVLLKVTPDAGPPAIRRSLDAALAKDRFRAATLPPA